MDVFYFSLSVQIKSVSNLESISVSSDGDFYLFISLSTSLTSPKSSSLYESPACFYTTSLFRNIILFYFFTTRMILHIQPGCFPSDRRDFALRLISLGSRLTPCVSHKAPHARTTTANLSFYRQCSDGFE